MAKKKEILLGIDPQIDFCQPTGSLYVPGADKDMERLGVFIKKKGRSLSQIGMTLDSHHVIDVGHSAMWVDSRGNYPAPYTIITNADLQNGVYRCRFPNLQTWFLDYTTQLEAKGKYPLIVWPRHCVIGSVGHAMDPNIFEALADWSTLTGRGFAPFTKGSNPKVEHYSAVQSEVIDPNDPDTQFNSKLVHEFIGTADVVYIAGEALSHCVQSTATDMFEALPADVCQRIIILEDCMSSVPGFEKQGADFLVYARSKGVQIARSTDF